LALAPTGTVSDAPPILPSGIRTAPPVPPDIRAVPPPVRVAETVNPYEAAAHEPVVPSQVPMTRQEFELRKAASDPNRPERAQMLRPYIEQLEANRSAENARRVEQYRKDLELHNQLKMKGLEYRAGEPERVLNREKLQQEIAKGKIPEVKQDVETGLVFNPATGEWEQPRIAGADPDRKPPFKGSEFQGKAMVNYGRARLAQEGLRGANEQLLAGSPVQSTLSSLPFGVGRPLRSDAYKEADTHAENFVQAFIRQQSGGAYTPTELESEARAMLPRYGDSEQIIQNKREQREQFLNGMYSIIGSSGQKSVDIDAARREADRAAHPAKETKPVDPLEGREAVFPDKSIRVRRDGKWVPK
jgi:hypothetical protein